MICHFSKFADEEKEQTFSFTKENLVQIKQLKQKNNLSAYPPNEKRKRDGSAHFWQRNNIS